MPSVIKRSTSHVAASTFSIYEGDDPKPGAYRAVIKKCEMTKSNGDNLMFVPVLELRAKDGSAKKEFDGYPVFPNIVLTDTEANVQREQAFYLAICGKQDAEIKTEGDPSKFKKGDKQKTPVTSIGGVKPVGKIVNVRLRMGAASDEYPARLECDLIFKTRDEVDSHDVPAEDDIEEDDVEADEDGLPLYEEEDLKSKALSALRKILIEEFDLSEEEAKALKAKAALVAKILELQDAEDEEVEEEDEEEEEEEEIEEDAEDEEDEEEDEEDAEEAVREELAGMSRVQLKAALKKREVDLRVTTKTTDDEIREALVPSFLADPPF